MPSNAPIVVNDGKATPESHTFDPSGMDSNAASYLNYAQDYPPGRETLKMSRASKANGKIREVTITLMVPNVQEVNGLNTVVDYRTYVIRCLVPVSTLEADLDSDTGLVANLLSNTLIKKAIERGEWVW